MTAEGLLAVWTSRDERYIGSRHVLSDESIAAVRSWRRQELAECDARDRGRLAREVLLWQPPTRFR